MYDQEIKKGLFTLGGKVNNPKIIINAA